MSASRPRILGLLFALCSQRAAQAEPGAPPRALPAAASCAWRAELSTTVPIAFRFTVEGAPFGFFQRGQLELAPAKPSETRALVATSDNDGVVLRGHVQASELEFYASEPLTLAGFVRPLPYAALRISSLAADSAQIVYRLDDDSALGVSPSVVSARVPCDRLALSPSAGLAWPPPAPTSQPAVLKRGSRVALSANADSAPIAWLDVRENSR